MTRRSIGIHIQCRLGSSRLPGKVLLPLGGRRLLGWVVHRCQGSEEADALQLAVGNRPENEAIVEWAKRNEVSFVQGSEENLLERHLSIADQHGADTIVRITGDCPFVPSSEIDQVIQAHRSNEAGYTTNAVEDMPTGFAVDVIDVQVLRELSELGDTHPVARLRDNPDKWHVAFTSDERWSAFAALDVSIDTPADYWRMEDAVSAVRSNPAEVCEWVLNRAESRPANQ